MKAIVVIVVIIIVLAGGGLLLVNHHNKSTNSPMSMPMPSSSSSTSSAAPSSQSQSSSAPASANAVTISNFAFSPASITVKKGTTVTWTNQDSVAHTVSETDGQTGPGSSSLNQGKSYSFTFASDGTFKYNCSIHPYMTGTVTVTD